MGPAQTQKSTAEVVVVGSCEVYAAGLHATFAAQGWRVAGRYDFVDSIDPDGLPARGLVVIDLSRDSGGVNATLEACRRLIRRSVRVLALTDSQQPDLFDRAMAVGLSGLLPRDVAAADLGSAARGILLGQTAFDRSFASRSLRAQVAPKKPCALSEKDRVLVRHLAEGRSTDDIARQLGRSPSTVKLRVGDLKRRFGAENRAGLVYMAIKQGLI